MCGTSDSMATLILEKSFWLKVFPFDDEIGEIKAIKYDMIRYDKLLFKVEYVYIDHIVSAFIEKLANACMW